jgi:K+-transporting ATPase ATPase B chain
MSVTTTPEATVGGGSGATNPGQRKIGGGLLDPRMLLKATPDAFKKLDPRVQIKNPVMFVVEVG